MARARNLKPGFFTNDQLAECSMGARLLFAGLWTLADRDGRLEDRPKKIKAEVLPYDEIDPNQLLNELQKHGFIVRYSAIDRQYIQVLNFKKHQNPHVNESASTIPAPDLPQISTIPIGPLTDSLLPITLSKDKDSPKAKIDSDEIFQKSCWLAWPKKRRCEKPNAKAAWREACRKIDPDTLAYCISRYVKTQDCIPDRVGNIFAPYPAKWLKRERWLEFMSESTTETPTDIETLKRYKAKGIPLSEEQKAILKTA